jgi:DNA modification methylase
MNQLFFGDNLVVMRYLPDESIDLIYIDPPFFTGHKHTAAAGSFSDVWKGGLPNYIAWLGVRMQEMRRLLKPTGLVYIHVDWHASHYIKIEADNIFGYDNLRNEIIWHYNSAPRKKKDFGRRHDTIFRYSKSSEYFFDDNPVREPYAISNFPKGKAHYYDIRGKVADDVWDIHMLAQGDRSERVGYPTQKPVKLLAKIIASSCPLDGIVADFCCGSGTALVAAEELGRDWIGCDDSEEAINITEVRLGKIPNCKPYNVFDVLVGA